MLGALPTILSINSQQNERDASGLLEDMGGMSLKSPIGGFVFGIIFSVIPSKNINTSFYPNKKGSKLFFLLTVTLR